MPGDPGHPARGDAGHRDHRVGLHAGGQGRASQLGPVIVNACDPELDGLGPRPAEARGDGRGRRWSSGLRRGPRSRPAASGWPATRSGRADRAAGPRAAAAPAPGALRSFSATDRARRARGCWPTALAARRSAALPRPGRGGRRDAPPGDAPTGGRATVDQAGRRDAVDHRVLRLGRCRQDDQSRPPSPWRRPEPGAGPAWSPSTRPGGWPTRSGVDSPWPTRRPRSRGTGPGELHALMLDPKGTFDDLVQRYARTPEQAESILANRLYQNLTGALSGTQEYMAMEKLYELVEDGGVRPGGGRHAADPQRPRPPRRPPAPHPVPGEPPLPGAADADPDVAEGDGGGHPGPAAHHLQGGGRRDRPGRGRPSSRPSRGWRRGSGPGRRRCASCWPTRPPPSCW